MAVTREEFEAYTDVQHSGVTNMFDVKTVSELSGLGRPITRNIMRMSKRHKIERYLDKYNHFMELVRTLTGLTVLVLQVIILLKLFT